MSRFGWALGWIGATVVHWAGYDARLSPAEREALVELYREELSTLPEPEGCCGETCDGECITTDTLGEWGR